MFNYSLKMSRIDEISLEQFKEECTHFDSKDKLSYELPTPIEVYNSYSSFERKEKPIEAKKREIQEPIKRKENLEERKEK